MSLLSQVLALALSFPAVGLLLCALTAAEQWAFSDLSRDTPPRPPPRAPPGRAVSPPRGPVGPSGPVGPFGRRVGTFVPASARTPQGRVEGGSSGGVRSS